MTHRSALNATERLKQQAIAETQKPGISTQTKRAAMEWLSKEDVRLFADIKNAFGSVLTKLEKHHAR